MTIASPYQAYTWNTSKYTCICVTSLAHWKHSKTRGGTKRQMTKPKWLRKETWQSTKWLLVLFYSPLAWSIQGVYWGLSSPCLTVGWLSVQGGHWSETGGWFSLMSHWKLAACSPAPLGCLLPASLLKHCLGLAALQDRIKTYTSTQIPVSSHLHQRLNDFFPRLMRLRFLTALFLPPLHQLQKKPHKKQSYWVTKMSQLFSHCFLNELLSPFYR